MEIDMSPAEYAVPRREEIAKIERCYSKSEEITIRGIIGMAILGCILGVIASIVVKVAIYLFTDLLDFDLYWGVFLKLGAILGVIIGPSYYIYSKVRSENYRQQRLREKEELENGIMQYTALFEEKAKERSVQFSQNPVVLRLADRIFNSYKQYISSISRETHIKKIHAEYRYTVDSNHISYQQNEYRTQEIDFCLERLRNLKSPLDQAALAQAIAMNIQSMISITDISGTFNQININYTYGSKSVTTTLTYTADNGYYRPVQDWV